MRRRFFLWKMLRGICDPYEPDLRIGPQASHFGTVCVLPGHQWLEEMASHKSFPPFSVPQLFASSSLPTPGTNVTRGNKVSNKDSPTLREEERRASQSAARARAITESSIRKGKSKDELQAEEERKADTVSRPGGFRNDPDDPTHPDEVRERYLRRLRALTYGRTDN
jgi:hypothetical protein